MSVKVLFAGDDVRVNQVALELLNDSKVKGRDQIVDVMVVARYADGGLFTMWSEQDTNELTELAMRAHIDVADDMRAGDDDGETED